MNLHSKIFGRKILACSLPELAEDKPNYPKTLLGKGQSFASLVYRKPANTSLTTIVLVGFAMPASACIFP
ncbi:MAG: hypothetical protein HFACDABA_02529 [Anaerolineales bacterium]|nr:hypothetical protein [Anaerolineales bacterium]